jgi:hypothetical protein
LPSPPRRGRPSDKELAACWTDLLGDDAGRAYAAIWKLTEAPEASVPLLRQHLQPATDAEVEAVRRLVTTLDSENFAAREEAFKKLTKLGALAEPVLRNALAQKPSLEARRRMHLLLETSSEWLPTGEQLRLLRVLEVLEKTGIQGHQLLHELAGGAEDAWLTRAAQSALTRTGPFLSGGTP